jgi:hypothetical protein
MTHGPIMGVSFPVLNKGAKKNHRNKLNTQQYYREYTRTKDLWALKALRATLKLV